MYGALFVELWNIWDFPLKRVRRHTRKRWDLHRHMRRCLRLRNALREIQDMEERRTLIVCREMPLML